MCLEDRGTKILKKLLEGRVREENHLGCARDSIRVDLEHPIIIAPIHICICIRNYSSPSNTRHQAIITHRVLLAGAAGALNGT